MNSTPWAAFCMSTFKRPDFLKKQLALLLSQTFSSFEIVISDNDPDGSAKEIALGFNDARIRYFNNGDNLGMIESFNKSIERSSAEYIVMVTDDDPVDVNLLTDMYDLHKKYPGFGLYGGFTRMHSQHKKIEIIQSVNFISEILDPEKTSWFLWSSCLLRRDLVLKVAKIPNYGSPHLADHALIGMVGSLAGGVIVNQRYSVLTLHDSNFSKFNFAYYVKGCKGFYDVMAKFCLTEGVSERSIKVVTKHLDTWFIACIFNLKKYYTIKKPDALSLEQVNDCAKNIMAFPFMKRVAIRYHLKNLIFKIKKNTGVLN